MASELVKLPGPACAQPVVDPLYSVGVAGLRAAVGVRLAGGVPDAAEQVRPEGRFGVRLLGVAVAGVERPAALVRLAPGDRVVGAHAAAGVASTRPAWPARARWSAGWCGSCTTRRCGLQVWPGARWTRARGPRPVSVACWIAGCDGKYAPTRLAVERPVVLGVGRGVHADVTVAGCGCTTRTRSAGWRSARRRWCSGTPPPRTGRGSPVVNASASSVAVTVKLLAAPRSRMVWMPDRDRVVAEPGGLGEDQHVVRVVGGHRRCRAAGARP